MMGKIITIQTIAEVFDLPEEATPDILEWLNGALIAVVKPTFDYDG